MIQKCERSSECQVLSSRRNVMSKRVVLSFAFLISTLSAVTLIAGEPDKAKIKDLVRMINESTCLAVPQEQKSCKSIFVSGPDELRIDRETVIQSVQNLKCYDYD